MNNVHVAELKLVFNALVKLESWEPLKEGIKQSIRVQLDGTNDPEVAIGLAREIQAIDKIFHTMETLCEENNGANENA